MENVSKNSDLTSKMMNVNIFIRKRPKNLGN